MIMRELETRGSIIEVLVAQSPNPRGKMATRKYITPGPSSFPPLAQR
jgi:hypothetical protein